MILRSSISLVALLACRGRSEPPPTPASPAPAAALGDEIRPIAIDPPAGPGAMAPSLRADGGGVLASWLERDAATGHRLVWSRWDGAVWSRAATITAGASIVANWADVPSIARGNDGALVASWAEQREGAHHAYDAIVARSSDGVAWRRLGALHDDATATEHGFVSLVGDGAGARAFWLDGRATAAGGAMALRTALIGETVGTSELVDERVCDCCATGAAAGSEGPVIVYRDRSEHELRDIAAVRHGAGAWSAPIGVGHDGWAIEGCPVNGPAIAAAGRRLVVAWYTAAGNVHRVRVAFSVDAGASFGPAIEVDGPEGGRAPLGRVGVVLADDGSAIVSWLAAEGASASLVARRIGADGTRGAARRIADTSAGRDAGVPRIARDRAELVFAWTEVGAPSRLRAVKLAIDDVPAPATGR